MRLGKWFCGVLAVVCLQVIATNAFAGYPGTFYSIMMRLHRNKDRKHARTAPSPKQLWAILDPPAALGSLSHIAFDSNRIVRSAEEEFRHVDLLRQFAPGDTTAAPDVTPASSDATSVAPDVTPASSDATSAASDVTPASSDATSAAPDVTSASSDATSSAPDVTPASSDATSAASDVTPASSDATSAASDVTPASSDATSAASDVTPVSSDATSAASDVTPASSDATSASSDVTSAAPDVATTMAPIVCGGNINFTIDPHNLTIPDGRIAHEMLSTPGWDEGEYPEDFECVWNINVGNDCLMGMMLFVIKEGHIRETVGCEEDYFKVVYSSGVESKHCGPVVTHGFQVSGTDIWTMQADVPRTTQLIFKSDVRKGDPHGGDSRGILIEVSGFCWAFTQDLLSRTTTTTTTTSTTAAPGATTESSGETSGATTQSPGATTSAATQSSGETTAATTQSPGATTAATTQSSGETTPATTQSSGATTGATTQSSGATNGATTQSSGETTAATTQSSGATTGAATESSGATTGATTQSPGATTAATTQSSQVTTGTATQASGNDILKVIDVEDEEKEESVSVLGDEGTPAGNPGNLIPSDLLPSAPETPIAPASNGGFIPIVPLRNANINSFNNNGNAPSVDVNTAPIISQLLNNQKKSN